MVMSVREIDRFLEQWEMDTRDLHRRMILAPTPRERHAVWLLAQGPSSTAELGRDPHTIAAAFGEGGPEAPDRSSPPPSARRSRRR